MEARERLALNHYLTQLDHPQVAFAVKQRTPNSLDAAASATLELESYVPPKQGSSAVSCGEVEAEKCEEVAVGAVSTTEKLTIMMEKLLERVEKLESSETGRQRPEGQAPGNKATTGNERVAKRDVICYRCGKKGHFARNCRKGIQPQSGNERPPA